jgi:hypothetical protein
VRAALSAVALVASLVASACGLYRDEKAVGTPTPGHANAVQAAGFEDAAGAWRASDGAGFRISDDFPHGGARSAALAREGPGIVSISQQIDVAPFPEYVSGFYRLDRWNPASGARVVEFVVTVRSADFPDGFGPHSMHFLIGGLDAAPANPLPGVAYVFLSRAAPQTGDWRYFGYPVALAFERAFGKAPTRWGSIELTLSAEPGDATVQFDDIYAGTQRDNPNRPRQE